MTKYRIQNVDVAPFLCYWCFMEIKSNKDIAFVKDLPHHRNCLIEIIKDKRRHDLINEILDYFELYQSESFIKRTLDDISGRILNFNLTQKDNGIELYVWTEYRLYVIKRDFDYVKNDTTIEFDYYQFKEIAKLLT